MVQFVSSLKKSNDWIIKHFSLDIDIYNKKVSWKLTKKNERS